ncbi:MAG: hypothetical protein WA510_11285 [Acidobacteriaceae bacterium]
MSFDYFKRSKVSSRVSRRVSRRKFVQRSLMAGAASSLIPAAGFAEKTSAPASAGPNLYQQIGVRPIVNAKGTYTICAGRVGSSLSALSS